MRRTFLKAKLHRATVTAADLNYEGSISLDRALCREAGLLEYEQVDIYDITNGVRFTTYVIYGRAGEVQLNGAAARLVQGGDRVIVAAYAELTPEEVTHHAPRVVVLGEHNAIQSVHADVTTAP
jgi:aspartate 1-decarboxylase